MSKPKVGDVIFYMHDNVVHSAQVLSYMTVDNLREINTTGKQKETWNPFGPSGTFYATVHGVYPLDKVYLSKQELLESL